MKKISILGSTGSVGQQALEVIDKLKDQFELVALTGGNNTDLLNKQIVKYKPKYASAFDLSKIENAIPRSIQEIVSDKSNDLILVAISGKDGLLPTLTALENGIDVALANKESIVMAGDLVMQTAKNKSARLLPVDSEHSAIHQCIKNSSEIEKIFLTASGGPFLHKPIDDVTQEDALKHPNWKMGKKITIDSATLMNKGFEVIEAHHLFNTSYDKIQVVIHPQSIIHSAVEYTDGSVIAQLGVPSMHIPIQYALTYPERIRGIKSSSFSFFNRTLEFEEPDFNKFKLLKLAYDIGKEGMSLPVCLNAVNDEVVSAFLNNQIQFKDIIYLNEKILEKCKKEPVATVEDILKVDSITRMLAKTEIQKLAK